MQRARGLREPTVPEGLDAFYRTYPCRIPVWRRDDVQTMENIGVVCQTMNGPNEFTITGRIRDRDVTDQPPRIRRRTLVTVGRHDDVTPRVAWAIHRGIRGSRLVVFRDSSPMAFREERPRYIEVVRHFLDGVG